MSQPRGLRLGRGLSFKIRSLTSSDGRACGDLYSVHICSPSARLTAEDVVMSFERNRLVGEIADGNPIGDVSAIGAFDFYARRMRACAGGRGHDFRCDEVVFRPVVGEPGFRGVWRQRSSELRTVRPAGLASTFPVTPAVLMVGARVESAGTALDRDAAFIVGTSSKRRAQYPRERLGEQWGMVPDRITVGAGPRVEPASGRGTAAVVSGCQRRPGL